MLPEKVVVLYILRYATKAILSEVHDSVLVHIDNLELCWLPEAEFVVIPKSLSSWFKC